MVVGLVKEGEWEKANEIESATATFEGATEKEL